MNMEKRGICHTFLRKKAKLSVKSTAQNTTFIGRTYTECKPHSSIDAKLIQFPGNS